MGLEAIQKGKSIVQMVVDQILTLIATGQLKVGESLPVESKLAEVFNIGRSTIREALRILETRDIIENIPRKGVFIRSIPEDLIREDTIDLTLNFGHKQLPELLETEFVILAGGTSLACRNRTNKDLQRMKTLLQEIKEPVELIVSGKANRKTYKKYADRYLEFFLCLGSATHNTILTKLLKAMLTNLKEHLPLFSEMLGNQDIDWVRPNYLLDLELVAAFEKRDFQKATVLLLKRSEELRRVMFGSLK